MKPTGNGKPNSKHSAGSAGRVGRSLVAAEGSSDGPVIITLDVSDIQLPGEGSSLPSLKRLGTSKSPAVPVAERSIEEKRLLIRKQLVVLLHAIVCRRRDLNMESRGVPTTECNVPFCGLMKSVLVHLNSCKVGRTCSTTHCPSSRQILLHWKYCVRESCPVCVTLRKVLPASLLSIFPNPLCRAELLRRNTSQQINPDGSLSQAVPELMDSEE